MPTKEIVAEQTVKHTPALGPLVAIDLTIATAGTADRPNIAVARVLTQAESDAMSCREDEDAYARLFAAAPDLLAALKAASEELVLFAGSPLRGWIDAAIAKAEGK